MAASNDAPSARAPDPEDLARLCRALNEAGALYVLIGGCAMIVHGAGRFIDLLIDDTPQNVTRVRQGVSMLADNAVAAVGDLDIRVTSYQVPDHEYQVGQATRHHGHPDSGKQRPSRSRRRG